MTINARKIDYADYELMRKSILIRVKPMREVRNSAIYYKDDIEEQKIQFFEVLKVSPNVTLVEAGQTVGIDWRNCTSQFEASFNGEVMMMGLSDEDQVEFIYYEQNKE